MAYTTFIFIPHTLHWRIQVDLVCQYTLCQHKPHTYSSCMLQTDNNRSYWKHVFKQVKKYWGFINLHLLIQSLAKLWQTHTEADPLPAVIIISKSIRDIFYYVCLVCERMYNWHAIFIYLFFFLQIIITPWLKTIRPGVKLCNTAENTTMTWSVSVAENKMTTWLKRERTQAFGLDSCTMNGSGRTKAALHSESGIFVQILQMDSALKYLLINRYCLK